MFNQLQQSFCDWLKYLLNVLFLVSLAFRQTGLLTKVRLLVKKKFLALYTVRVHTVSFDWFLSGLEWILNLEFCLLKLLIFYQKLLWIIRSRLNSSTFWVFRPVFRYVWSKLKLCAQKMKILIKYILVNKTQSWKFTLNRKEINQN